MTETEQVKKIKWNENTISVHTQTHAESTIWKCFRSLRLKLLLPLMELYCCYCCIRHALHIRTHIHTCHLLFALFSNLCTKHTFLYCLHLHCVISPKKKQFLFRLFPLFYMFTMILLRLVFASLQFFQKPKKKCSSQKRQTNNTIRRMQTPISEFCLLWLCSSIKYTITHYAYAKRERDVLCA